MTGPSRSVRLLSLSNVAVLAGTSLALLKAPARSTAFVAMCVACALVVLVALLTVRPPIRRWVFRRPDTPIIRTILAAAPWLVVVAVIAANGLWWTQRPAALRFFLLYALANWSAAWCLGGERSSNPWLRAPGRALAVLALLLGALGLQGAAFGVTPFGCGLSAALAAAGALALAIASFAGRAAHLKAFAASAAALAACVVLEAAVRVLHIGQNVQEVDNRELARQFYSLTPPGSAFVNDPTPLDEFDPALVEINSLGIRGPELAEPRADLLLIGDSMIEARQLPWEQTLGPRLQHALRSRGLQLRVVAHGMRGWAPLLEWNWYLKVGRRLQPKTVFVFFFWNDLWTRGDEVSTFGAELDADGRPKAFNLPADPDWIWYKHVRVVRVVADVWRRLSIEEVRRAFRTVAARKGGGAALDDASAERLTRTLTSPPLTAQELEAMLTKPEHELPADLRALFADMFWPSLRPMALWTDAQHAAAAHTERELERFAEDVRTDGGRLVLVYVPNPLQVGGNECALGRLFARVNTGVILPRDSGIQRWLRAVSQRHDIEFLDASDEMLRFNAARPPGDTAALYLRADCHWSARGHRFMAEYLAEWVQRAHDARPVSPATGQSP